jgi:hypothetical protein
LGSVPLCFLNQSPRNNTTVTKQELKAKHQPHPTFEEMSGHMKRGKRETDRIEAEVEAGRREAEGRQRC